LTNKEREKMRFIFFLIGGGVEMFVVGKEAATARIKIHFIPSRIILNLIRQKTE